MTHDMTFDQRLARIDLRAVMAHVQADTGLSDADIGRAEQLYRQFLTLIATYPDHNFVPPKLVDAVWHTHITFTRQYATDCELLFGEFLHHTPDLEGSNEMFADTIAAYAKNFGVNLQAYGIAPEMAAAGCGNSLMASGCGNSLTAPAGCGNSLMAAAGCGNS